MPGNDAYHPDTAFQSSTFHPPLPVPSPAEPLFYRVLGPVGVEQDGRPVHLGRPQARTVLAVLILARGVAVSVDRLIDALWGDDPPSSGRVQLQGHISNLRRALGARSATDPTSPIRTTPSGYRLDLADGQLDLDVFRASLAEARRLLAEGDATRAADRLRSALALWQGEPFAGITVRAVRDAAEPLAELRLAAVQDRIEADLACGLDSHLIPELRQLVAQHPFRERLWGFLMTALAHAGRAAEALATYRQVWRLLRDELGIVPSVQLQNLHQTILRGCAC